jgi:hypothetical protein
MYFRVQTLFIRLVSLVLCTVAVRKVFVLVYNLQHPEALFQRFPGLDGSLYYKRVPH